MVLVGASFGAALAFWVAHRLGTAAKALVAIAAAAPRDGLPAFNYHLLSEEALKAELDRTKLVPATFLENSAALTPILKALRGMSRIIAAGGSIPAGPLACPIVALYPTRDATVRRDDMDTWRRLTAARFALIEYRGGHSVLMDEPHMLLESIGLEELLEQARGD